MARLIGQVSMQGLERGLGEAIGLADLVRNPGDDSSPRAGGDWFERLVGENQERVTRLVYRLLGWRGEVEDIVQDVFLAAFKSGKNFRDESSEWTWLAAIAINRCRTHQRKKLLEFRWLREVRIASTVEPKSELERDETVRCVRKAVAALPARDREVVVLYYLEDWSVAEICRATVSSAGAVDIRLHRAREKLRGILGQSPE
jgi:RNA polymerase sigma factor (sigma-70 family)